MEHDRFNKVASVMQVTRETKQEYDDNNYFSAEFISGVFGISCDLGSYHQEDIIPHLVKDASNIVTSNTLKFITENSKQVLINQLEELKNSEKEYGHYPELIDMLKKCVENNITFKEFEEVICSVSVY